MDWRLAMRALLLVLIGGAICYNYTQSVTVSDVFWRTLGQLPIFVLIACVYEVARRYFVQRWSWGAAVFYAFFAFYAIVTIGETYLCLFVKSGYTPSILTFLFQTNVSESQGFVHAYLTNKMFLLYVVSLLLITAVVWCVIFLLPGSMLPLSHMRSLIIASLLLATMFPVYPCTSVSRLAYSTYHYCRTILAENDICSDTKIKSVNNEPHVIVLIIGEAFSKHHSSLYGYRKQTNPCLEALVSSGNLYLFKDVAAPYNKTHMMLKELLSVHDMDAQKPWNSYPLWPQIFKDAGYYVSFVSNQVPSSDNSWYETYFFQKKEVEQRCFDYRNNYAYRFDEGILNELQTISGLGYHANELAILHLGGQHIYATSKFPHERFTRFHPSDYLPHSISIDSRQAQELADYDNATLFNDYVVSRIMKWYEDREAIVVYLSDHGEEVHDYRQFLGRSHAVEPTKEEIKYQYEVPFMIYLSDAYKQHHPDVVRQIKEAQTVKLMSDDLSFMLLGLSGIRTEWYDPSKDVLSVDYLQPVERRFGY